MSTGLIIAIVAVAVIVLVALVALRPALTRRRRERELNNRREQRAGELRTQAEQREQRASVAEKQAQIAAAEAERERAAARVHQQQADMHEQGLRDDELIDDDERERFAGTSAFNGEARDGEDTRAIDGEGRGERIAREDPAAGPGNGNTTATGNGSYQPAERSAR